MKTLKEIQVRMVVIAVKENGEENRKENNEMAPMVNIKVIVLIAKIFLRKVKLIKMRMGSNRMGSGRVSKIERKVKIELFPTKSSQMKSCLVSRLRINLHPNKLSSNVDNR
jgi:hypothetical protein